MKRATPYPVPRISSAPLYGLVLAGGLSSRMHTDKGWLRYHGATQIEHVYALLSAFCQKVLVSTRLGRPVPGGLPCVFDPPGFGGPMAGLLAGMGTFPGVAWLALACDMPFADSELLAELVSARDAAADATAFAASDGGPEPLCAIYEPHFYPVARGGLRGALAASEVRLLQPACPNALRNVNEPLEREQALREIAR